MLKLEMAFASSTFKTELCQSLVMNVNTPFCVLPAQFCVKRKLIRRVTGTWNKVGKNVFLLKKGRNIIDCILIWSFQGFGRKLLWYSHATLQEL